MAIKSLRNHSHHLDKRLRFRLRLYFLITLILLGILIYDMARGALRFNYAFLGLLAGAGVGIISSRMFHTSWDKDAKKVISRLDTFGLGILILYIVFEVLQDKIVTLFTHDVQVATTGFAVLAGSMLGRFIGSRGKIIEILKEQKVFS